MKIPPVEEVRSYFASASLNGDADEFYDHFESNGWVVGRTPMKKWEAAARNWSRHEIRWGGKNGKKSYPDRKEIAEFNRMMAGANVDDYRKHFKQKFGVEPREEKP